MLVRLTGWSVVFGMLATVAAGCTASAPPDEEQGEVASNEVVAAWPIVAANNKVAFDYFLGKGLTNIQAAGIVGNLDQESGMDPTISQIGGGPGRGIAQWSAGGRWDRDTNDNVRAFAAQEGKPMKSLDVQLDFVWYELTTFPHYGLAQLRAATTVTSAVVAFQNKFEACGNCAQANRVRFAQAALNAYGGDTPSGDDDDGGSAAPLVTASQ
jgi:hypothetical protein